jgi:hypothetical protein
MLPLWITRPRFILLDANLLVVVIVGKTRRDLLGRGSVKDYQWKDFKKLIELLAEFEATITTPQVLAEVNSLLNKTGYAREECRARLASEIPFLKERLISSASVSTNPAFPRYGLTDLSIKEAASDDTLVLSSDWPLIGYLQQTGTSSLHYDHLT